MERLMSQYLGTLIEELEKELPDNHFILFLKTLKDKEYGVHEKPSFLKGQYDEILKFYEMMKAKNED
jgi:hypothetical protein